MRQLVLVVVNEAFGLIWVLLAEQFKKGRIMRIVGEFLFMVKEPLQFFCEMPHLSLVVIGQGLQEFALILLDVFVDCFHSWGHYRSTLIS